MTDHLPDAEHIRDARIQELLDTALDGELLYHGSNEYIISFDVLAEVSDCLRELKALRARWSNFEAMLTKQAADAKSGAGRSIAESIHEEATILNVLNTMRRLSGSAGTKPE